MNLSRLALVAIATARLTRFVTSDWLGEWTLVRPLKRMREVRGRKKPPDYELLKLTQLLI